MDCYDVNFYGREGILEVQCVESPVYSRPLANNLFSFQTTAVLPKPFARAQQALLQALKGVLRRATRERR